MNHEKKRFRMMNIAQPNIQTRKAFTLIELLAVIAIIAILAALLLPALARAKLQGRQAVCMSNEKQLSLGAHMYMDDNKKFFPATSGYGTWQGDILPYVSQLSFVRLCPMTPPLSASQINKDNTSGEWSGCADKAWYYAGFSDPQMVGGAADFEGGYGLNGNFYSDLSFDTPPDNFVTASDVITPVGKTPLFADALWCDGFPKMSDTRSPDLYTLTWSQMNSDNGTGLWRFCIARHGNVPSSGATRNQATNTPMLGAINVVFYDGHGELVPLESLWSLYWSKSWVPRISPP